ncbi:Fc.00g060210.m01.CDS01 [Cosmosporella sp. VM-42]
MTGAKSVMVEATETPDIENSTASDFSSFNAWQKRWIVFIAAFAGMFSPMSSFIFYPAITSIASSLHVGVNLVNLAITTYMVVSGVVPALLGNAADKPNVAPPLGPVLGGVVAARLGWRWIFWLLCILGGACLVVIVFTFPETSRVVVGNGSVPPKGIHRALLSCLTRSRKNKTTDGDPPDQVSNSLSFPSPLTCLKLFLLRDVAVVLFCNATFYTVCCCIQASLSTLFIDIYGYDSLEAGLIYIPYGISCLISSFAWGKLLNFDYAQTAQEHGIPVNKAKESNSYEFPVEKARLRSAFYLVAVTTVGTMAYGWVIQHRVHVAVPLVLQAFIGFSGTGLFVALGTLLTDLNPTRSSTAAASSNLVRCALAAMALAVLQPIINRIGAGWCFTIFGALSGLCGPLMFWEIRRGHIWRQKRTNQEDT